MKTLLSISKNWRADVLIALAWVALMLLLSESDVLSAFVLTKVLGAAFAAGCWALGRYWGGQGKINALRELCGKE